MGIKELDTEKNVVLTDEVHTNLCLIWKAPTAPLQGCF